MSDLSDEVDATTLARYLSGECDPSEAQRIHRWIEADPERRRQIDALRSAWTKAESPGPAWNLDALWSRVAARMDRPGGRPSLSLASPDSDELAPTPPRPRILTLEPRRRARVPLAAAAVVLLAAGLHVLQQRTRSAPVAEQVSAMREVATAAGQRAEITLGDGSTVVLGVKSRLRIPTDFGGRSRELTLEGQAYFRVVHDRTRPFVVNAAGSRTLDLGTAFVVRAYAGDEAVQVVVTEGSVAFGAAAAREGPTVLREGRRGRLARGETMPEVRAVDPAEYTAWMQGRLTFDDTPLDQVAAELGRWYDAEVHLADTALARETLTATFGSESLTDAISTITTVLQLQAEYRGTTVTLRRRGR